MLFVVDVPVSRVVVLEDVWDWVDVCAVVEVEVDVLRELSVALVVVGARTAVTCPLLVLYTVVV